MWRRFTNFVLGLKTYSDLSPNLGLRRRINQTLRSRSSRSLEESYTTFWKPLAVSKELIAFIYEHLEISSGLQFARILPRDRLTEDLKLTEICWADWEFNLCSEFYDRFGIDICDRFDFQNLVTVEDLVVFLNQQLSFVEY
jgi:hypothetical protein